MNTTNGHGQFERNYDILFYVGQHLGTFAYGIHVSIFSVIVYLLLCKPAAGKISWPPFVYSVLLLACGTINAVSNIKLGETAWLGNSSNIDSFVMITHESSMETMGNVAVIVANILANGLLLFRCFIIWDRSVRAILFPASLFASSAALSITTVYQAAIPGMPVWKNTTITTGIPYWCLSIVFNVLVSLMICGQLLWHSHTIAKVLGKSHTTLYTTLSAMFIESAALYAVIGVIHVILFARDSLLHNLVLGVMAQVECIAPDLIILRTSLGRAWHSKGSIPDISADIKFTDPSKHSPSPHFIMDISSTAGTAIDFTSLPSNVGSDYCHSV